MVDVFNVGRISKSGERFEWSIPDFSHARDNAWVYLHSPDFSSSGIVWDLTLVIPWGSRCVSNVFFRLRIRNRPLQDYETPVAFACGLKTSNGEIVARDCSIQTLSEIGRNYSGFKSNQISYTGLQRRCECLPSGTLTLVFRLLIADLSADGEAERTAHAPGVEECPRCKNPTDEATEKDAEKTKNLTKLSDDFKDLLLNETDTDVVLKVGDREFKAHRSVIRTRSPVLFAMFAHDTEEKRTGVVNIVDCDPDTFPDFLHYVYTGQVEELTEEKSLHLYRTADKYQVLELKEQCLGLLKKGVSVDNFCDVLALSLQHNERELTEMATQFFANNSSKIKRSPRWETFLQENPTITNELFLKSYQTAR